MQKQCYTKTFMVMEKYIPQEFVAIYEVPKMKYSIISPRIENSKQEGYQDNGNNMNDKYNNWNLYFDSYEQSYAGGVYTMFLKSNGIMRRKSGKTVIVNENSPFPIGTITYMANYNPTKNVTPTHS